jgi:hypothetical protein
MISRLGWAIEYRTDEKSGQKVPFYLGRRVITRDSPIRGGVYLGCYEREAIVVSDDDGVLPDMYRSLRRKLGWMRRGESESVLRKVYEFVREMMPQGSDAVYRVVAELDVHDDAKVSLSRFVAKRCGVCRHRALFAADLLERLVADKVIKGRVSCDRNETNEGGHAWARFTTKGGRVFILDAGLGDFGELYGRSQHKLEARWAYHRPEDPAELPPMQQRQRPRQKQNTLCDVALVAMTVTVAVYIVLF